MGSNLVSDVYGPPDIRCPACKKFVQQGSNHKCPNGRHREVFVDPAHDKNKS